MGQAIAQKLGFLFAKSPPPTKTQNIYYFSAAKIGGGGGGGGTTRPGVSFSHTPHKSKCSLYLSTVKVKKGQKWSNTLYCYETGRRHKTSGGGGRGLVRG